MLALAMLAANVQPTVFQSQIQTERSFLDFGLDKSKRIEKTKIKMKTAHWVMVKRLEA